MEYITVREAAKKWNISERLVQKYCAQGRIKGADKFGASWQIPSDAVMPQDPRRSKTEETSETACKNNIYEGLMPLMNTAFKPGHCMECIEKMEGGYKKEIALAEYHYFSGCPEKAAREAERLLNCTDGGIRLSACLIYAYSNLSIGHISRAKYALEELKKLSYIFGSNQSSAIAAQAFISAAAAVLLHLPLPEGLPPVDEYLYMLPAGIRLFALYVQAHYTYLQGDYSKSLGIAETALALSASEYPIPAIYLHLVAVMDYMSLKDSKKAKEHLETAWKIAKPDDLIEGFGEHHGLLGGMLEAVIKKDHPDDFKRIIAITYSFSAGWRRIHNPYTGHDVADNLTTTEFAIAMLAARGWTNKEIGEHMGISENTVKRNMSTVLQKLDISKRQELKRFMLR